MKTNISGESISDIIIRNEEKAVKDWCRITGFEPNDACVKTVIRKRYDKIFLTTRVIPYINYHPESGTGLAHTVEEDITEL